MNGELLDDTGPGILATMIGAKKQSHHWRLGVLALVLLPACDGAVQLCGEYACVYYQNTCDQNANCDISRRECETASSIRNRVPKIINELRVAQRQCSSTQDNADSASVSVAWDAQLASASATHARDMAKNNFESFTGSDGSTSVQRVSLSGFLAAEVHESIGSGPQTAAEIINRWLDLQTDCSALVHSRFDRLGMACETADAGQDRGPYWSLLLATAKTNSSIHWSDVHASTPKLRQTR